MHRLHQLPQSFHSDETAAPFTHCCDCRGDLSASEDGYFIQKAYAGEETTMEIAICFDCHEKLQASYSAESREAIWNFYLDHGDLAGRLKKFAPLPVGNPGFWINSCVTCGTLRRNTAEHIVAAQCIDGNLVYGDTPMMVCMTCVDQIVERLSEESREIYDRWIDHVYPPGPGLANDKPRTRRRILI